MKKTIISLSLVTCMALGLGVHNLGIITNMKDYHKNDITMNLSLENDGTSFVGPMRGPGETEPK
jgi:hypothetical protein